MATLAPISGTEDPTRGHAVLIFSASRLAVSCISISADGSLIAVGCTWGSITIFEAECLQLTLQRDNQGGCVPMQSIQAGDKQITSLSWSHLQSRTVAAGFANIPDVILYNVASGAESSDCSFINNSVATTLLRRGESLSSTFSLATRCVTHVHKRMIRCNEQNASKLSMVCREDVIAGCANGFITGWCISGPAQSAASLQPSWSARVSQKGAVAAVELLSSDFGAHRETLSYVLVVACSAGELALWEVFVAPQAGAQHAPPLWCLKTISANMRIIGAVPVFHGTAGCDSCLLRAESVLRKAEKKLMSPAQRAVRKPTVCRVQGWWPEVLLTGRDGQLRVYDNIGSTSVPDRFRCVKPAGLEGGAALPAVHHVLQRPARGSQTYRNKEATSATSGWVNGLEMESLVVASTVCGHLEGYPLWNAMNHRGANQLVGFPAGTRKVHAKCATYSTQLPGRVLKATTGSPEIVLSHSPEAMVCSAESSPLHRAKSHELQFDWSLLLPVGIAAVDGDKTQANHSADTIRGVNVTLQGPYLGPIVRDGVPTVRVFTKLSTKMENNLQPSTPTHASAPSSAINCPEWRFSAVAAHPSLSFLVAGVSGKGVYALRCDLDGTLTCCTAAAKQEDVREDTQIGGAKTFQRVNCSVFPESDVSLKCATKSVNAACAPSLAERSDGTRGSGPRWPLISLGPNADTSSTRDSVRAPVDQPGATEAATGRVSVPRGPKRVLRCSREVLDSVNKQLKKAKKISRHRDLYAQDVALRNANNTSEVRK